jgi:hypothetical protein
MLTMSAPSHLRLIWLGLTRFQDIWLTAKSLDLDAEPSCEFSSKISDSGRGPGCRLHGYAYPRSRHEENGLVHAGDGEPVRPMVVSD